MEGIPEVERIDVIEGDASRMSFRAFPKDLAHSPANEIMARLVQNGFKLDSFHVENGRLDEVFRMVTSAAEGEK